MFFDHRVGSYKLQAAVGRAQGKDAFHVVKHSAGLTPGFQAFFAHGQKLVVPHGQHDGGVLPGCGGLGQALQAVFVFSLVDVDPESRNINLNVIAKLGFLKIQYLDFLASPLSI